MGKFSDAIVGIVDGSKDSRFLTLHFCLLLPSYHHHREHVTVLAIVLGGRELKADIIFQGPIGPSDIDSTIQLTQAVEEFERHGVSRDDNRERTDFEEVVDFEHLSILDELPDDDGIEEDDDAVDDDEALQEMTSEQRKAMREKQRRKALERKKRKQAHQHKQRAHARREGEPFVKTFRVKETGWYRFCLKSTSQPITVEADFRKESELGGLNEETGHVNTFEEMAMKEEDKIMDADTAEEEGIKDEDFAETKEKLKTLRRLLAEIQSKQQQERHRLIVHSATNEHSHSRMVLGSLLETILFMVVTGVQIMTIRRWFKGAPVLGR